MTTPSPVLSIRELKKSYFGIPVLRGVDLDVMPGEVFGLIGPNGCGKTTMVECAIGLRVSQGGEITINGLDPNRSQRDLAKSLGVVFQEGSIDGNIKLTHYYAFRTSYGRKLEGIDEDMVWENFGLSSKKHSRFGSLSGGQKQRTMIATTLASSPFLAIMDEPTSGLDPTARYEFWQSIRYTASRDTSVLVTTHNLSEAQDYCDRIAIMDKGEILCCGAINELLIKYGIKEVCHLKTKVGEDTKQLEEKISALPSVTRVEKRFDALMLHLAQPNEAKRALGSIISDKKHSFRPGILDDLFFTLVGKVAV